MITTDRLVKRYGDRTVLDHVDLRVEPGTVYGLVGPNGAGKTTILSLLAGLRTATEGSVSIAAEPREIAILPDTPRLDPWLTGHEVVALADSLVSDSDGNVEHVLEIAGLSRDASRQVGGYSRGMLQRLGMACTVVGDPKVMLLDEPASALDPQGRREMLDLIDHMKGRATVLFSSHILADVQQVCDTVGVLHQGRLLFQGTLDELLVGAAVPRYVVRVRPPLGDIVAGLDRLEWVTSVEVTGSNEIRVTVASISDAESHLGGALAACGARVVSTAPEAVSLERAFLELTS
ncbi:MAG: ABC transporter ATP-binding protein [Acidimicrobiia bacterium]|nr:ABC transporter ATP-binding protein [Acidimicrobiia bacterium]